MTEFDKTKEWEETPDQMAGLGQLARIAWQAWHDQAPTAFHLIKDPKTFFSKKGDLAQQEQDAIAAAMQGPDVPGESTMAKAGRITQATNAAREIVIAQICLPPNDLQDANNNWDDSDPYPINTHASRVMTQAHQVMSDVDEILELDPDDPARKNSQIDMEMMLDGTMYYYLLPWVKEQADPNQNQEMYEEYQAMLQLIKTRHAELVARCREYLGQDAIPVDHASLPTHNKI